jgi:hypothetical protein
MGGRAGSARLDRAWTAPGQRRHGDAGRWRRKTLRVDAKTNPEAILRGLDGSSTRPAGGPGRPYSAPYGRSVADTPARPGGSRRGINNAGVLCCRHLQTDGPCTEPCAEFGEIALASSRRLRPRRPTIPLQPLAAGATPSFDAVEYLPSAASLDRIGRGRRDEIAATARLACPARRRGADP